MREMKGDKSVTPDINVPVKGAGAPTRCNQADTRKTRTRDPRRTVKRILEAAEQEFEEYGFAEARVARIAETARTSKQIIYNYFSNKDGLYVAVVNELIARHRAYFSEVDFCNNDPKTNLRNFISAIFKIFSSHSGRLESTVMMSSKSILPSIKFPKGTDATVNILRRIIQNGKYSGCFNNEVDEVDLYILIFACSSSFNYLNDAIHDIKVLHSSVQVTTDYWMEYITEVIIRSVSAP